MGWSRYFHRSRWDEERFGEIQSYIETETDENVARGMSPEEAHFAAHRKFGNVTFIREEIYRMNTIGFIESLWQDLRYAFRSLRRSPGFTVTAIITLALGIGANTTIFSVVDAAIFRPLPYRDPDRLVSIQWVTSPGTAEQTTYVGGVTREQIEDWRAQKQIFSGVEPYSNSGPRDMKSGMAEHREPISVENISPGMLDLLGVQPVLGRGFRPEEGRPGNDNVLLLSSEFWTRVFGADPAALGKTISLDNRIYTIIGVMPPDFHFPVAPVAAWAPWTGQSPIQFIGRIRHGLSIAQAQRETALASDRIRYKNRNIVNAKMTAELSQITTPSSSFNGTRTTLLVLLGAVGFVLLNACANVANLLLSRAMTRQHEIAIRAAIGASRGRLVRQFLVESLILSGVGSLAAVTLAWWMIRLIPGILPKGLPLFAVHELALNGRVFAFMGAVTLLACLMSGMIPAFRAASGGLTAGLAGTNRLLGITRATRRLQVVFQALQVGLSLVLLCGAGLMANSLVRMALTENGYDTKNLSRISISLPSKGDFKGSQNQTFWDQLAALVKTIPGVQSAALSVGVPPSNAFHGQRFPEGDLGPNDQPWVADINLVTPGFFSTLQIPLVAGRNFSPEDRPSSPPVTIIDRRAAEHFWPGQSALGKRIRSSSRSPWTTVVGIVKTVKTPSFTYQNYFQEYWPLSQNEPYNRHDLIIRTTGDPRPVLAQVRAMTATLAPDANISYSATFDENYATIAATTATTPRFYLILMSIFAGVALATAAVGVCGVLSYSVTRRTSEIGIRVALGASANDIRRLILRSVIAPVLAGILIGLIGSFWLTRLLKSLLYQVTPHDPFTMALVAGLMLIVAFVATILPTRRARRVDPIIALRVE